MRLTGIIIYVALYFLKGSLPLVEASSGSRLLEGMHTKNF